MLPDREPVRARCGRRGCAVEREQRGVGEEATGGVEVAAEIVEVDRVEDVLVAPGGPRHADEAIGVRRQVGEGPAQRRGEGERAGVERVEVALGRVEDTADRAARLHDLPVALGAREAQGRVLDGGGDVRGGGADLVALELRADGVAEHEGDDGLRRSCPAGCLQAPADVQRRGGG